jgi:EAL domain-containing protein (putative c-di-GMP-specific phosphodiesterase class I)
MATVHVSRGREPLAPGDLSVRPGDPIRLGVHAVYQPIVHLDGGEVVAYEALARGPRGSQLETPGELFAFARDQGRLAELDLACRVAALHGAIDGGLRAPGALFINVEPEVPGDGGSQTAGHVPGELEIFFEVTERALTLRPAELLKAVERVRRAGFGIALDDVGADRRSLALLPLLRPDVVKLDMTLIQNHPSRLSGEVMNGVCAYAEQTGAVIVAEGVEEERHLVAARSLGASLAQGWLFGRPGPLPAEPRVVRSPVTLGLSPRVTAASPVALAPDDEVVGEWDVAVLGPHYAGALVARDVGDPGHDRDRRFEFVLTFDRELVIDVAASLIDRVSGTRADTSQAAPQR